MPWATNSRSCRGLRKHSTCVTKRVAVHVAGGGERRGLRKHSTCVTRQEGPMAAELVVFIKGARASTTRALVC